MAESPMIRKLIYFQGHVQGVGFRMTVYRIASDFQVTGYIRNLPDGRVELVAEGSRDEVSRFVERVQETMAGYVRHVDHHPSNVTGEFERFTIEY
jgi:acylphosphatase